MDDLDLVTAASLDDLAACLRRIHLLADKPTYRTLEQRTARENGFLPGTRLRRVRLARTTVSDMLLGRKFPSKAFLLTFVDACGIDLENDRRWGQAWDRLAVQDQQAAAVPGEMEKLRQENEELRRQLAAVKRQAETAESRDGPYPRLDMATSHATRPEGSPEWDRKYISVNPNGTIDIYDLSIAIQIVQDIGQSYE